MHKRRIDSENNLVEIKNYIAFPKMLFEEEYTKMDIKSKFLYSFLLERNKLSYKNGIKDKDEKAYVRMSLNGIAKELKIKRSAVITGIKTLVKFGLIINKRGACFELNHIYVKVLKKEKNRCVAIDFNMEVIENQKFIKIPRELIKSKLNLSHRHIMIYSILIDKMKLSIKNGIHDENFIYTVSIANKEMAEYLNISVTTLIKTYKKLEKLEIVNRKRRSRKPSVIYLTQLLFDDEEIEENKGKINVIYMGKSTSNHKFIKNNKNNSNESYGLRRSYKILDKRLMI